KQRKHDYLVWEFYGYGGQQAVRFGPWKAVRQQCYKNPDGPLMLFNLESDPAEQVDLAAQHPELVKQAENILEKEHSESPFWDFRLKRHGPPKVIEAASAP
ncbi:MAG: hypothetical protein H5U08_10485, partial [Thermogutta sp.]|nr:hypothetical protein [Thermogutta sp.]